MNASTSPPSSPKPAYPAPAEAFTLSAPVRLWEDGFAADPHRYYDALRAQGPLGWAELAPGVPAYVVTDRQAALDLLHTTPPGRTTRGRGRPPSPRTRRSSA